MLGIVPKKPADQLDYVVDFSDWIPDDDTILTATADVTPAGELVIDSVHVDTETPRVQVWASAGNAGTTYVVAVTAATAGGRIKQENFKVRVGNC